MNSYPIYVPPGSGFTASSQPVIYDSEHLGVYDVLTWKTGDPFPISRYHPMYQHNICDVNLYRTPVDAASIEMGVGVGIANVARFANANNLGSPNQRVGVAYFKNLGYSGSVNWWLDSNALNTINIWNDLAFKNLNTNLINIYSGCVDSKFNLQFNPTLTIQSFGSGYIDKVSDGMYNPKWYFEYGNIYTLNNINLFNNKLSIDSSNISGSIYNDILFRNHLAFNDINLPVSGLISGYHTTFLSNGISDTNFIIYSASGHTHSSSGWLQPIVDTEVIGNTIYDGRYYYNFSTTQVLKMDYLSSNTNWSVDNSRLSLTEVQVNPLNSDSRIYKDKSNMNVFSNGYDVYINSVPYSITADKKGTLNNLILSCNIGDHKISITDGVNTNTFTIQGSVSSDDEFYYFDNNLYYVHFVTQYIYIYKFNGTTWTSKILDVESSYFVSMYLSDSEIFIILFKGDTTYLYRYNDVESFTLIDKFLTLMQPSQASIIEQLFVCVYDNTVTVFSINNPDIYYKLFTNVDETKKLSVYQNQKFIFVQFGNMKRMLRTNVSSSLSLDAITGIMSFTKGIHIKGSLITDSVVVGFVVDSLYHRTLTIYNDNILLKSDSKYVNRLIYDNTISTSYTYNDLPSATLFQDKFYFGTRGALSIFRRQNDNTFTEPTPVVLPNQIPVRFLPLENSLLMLVQDFTNATIDFISPMYPPSSPYAKDQPLPNSYGRNYISYIPGLWSVPMTRIYQKDNSSERWNEVLSLTQRYGNNIIDAITYDNHLYIIAHDFNSSSGIISAKFYANKFDNPIALTCSGSLPLNESFVGYTNRFMSQQGLIYAFIPTSDGNYTSTQNTYSVKSKDDINGFHEFYMYNCSTGPYVIHDAVELLVDTIQSNSIYPLKSSLNVPTSGFVINDKSSQYNYRTISLSFLNKPESRLNNSVYFQIPDRDINNPNFKIPIIKEYESAINPTTLADKYLMKDVANASSRSSVHFITSVTLNKIIYILIQVQQTLRIYAVREQNDYQFKIPNSITTVCGVGDSYAGVKYSDNWSGLSQAFSLEYVPFHTQNLLVTQIDLTTLIPNTINVHVLGDGDDLFIEKPTSKDYRLNKRYATPSSMVLGGSLYLPLTCRENHPTGKIYSFILGFFSDDSIGLVDKDLVPVQMIENSVGRSQFIYKDGRYVASAIRLEDGEKLTVSYSDIKNDPIYSDVVTQANPTQFSNMYNTFGKKHWTIGEYDIKVEDNLNVREII